MPCYEIQTLSVKFQANNDGLLEKAAKGLGYSWRLDAGYVTLTKPGASLSIDLAGERVSVRQDQQPLVNELKRAYSQEALRMAGRLGGWQVKMQSQQKGQLLRNSM